MKQSILSIFIVLILAACAQDNKKLASTMNQFDVFRKKEKFTEDTLVHYTGVNDPALKSILTEKINTVADDFEKLALTQKAIDKDYQDKIEIGLKRFNRLYLDTEDKEQVCRYVEELMDIVGVKSSDGHLNTFIYGLDPEKM